MRTANVLTTNTDLKCGLLLRISNFMFFSSFHLSKLWTFSSLYKRRNWFLNHSWYFHGMGTTWLPFKKVLHEMEMFQIIWRSFEKIYYRHMNSLLKLYQIYVRLVTNQRLWLWPFSMKLKTLKENAIKLSKNST